MCLGDVVDELHNKHSLAHTGTAEQADLATTLVGGQQVDDLQQQHRAMKHCIMLRHPTHTLGRLYTPVCGWSAAERLALMPVTRIAASVDCSMKAGASRWMEHWSEASA